MTQINATVIELSENYGKECVMNVCICRHDVAQIAGLTAMSFGMEDLDRYIVVYKKEYAPSEDEIFARRNGEDWNDATAQKYAQMVI